MVLSIFVFKGTPGFDSLVRPAAGLGFLLVMGGLIVYSWRVWSLWRNGEGIGRQCRRQQCAGPIDPVTGRCGECGYWDI